ncbi:hypothetical protein G210_1189, partial [Candida maltosa Xu316]
LINASIYMGFPFDEQLPNIGRVNKDYTFTLANTTYKSNSNGQISYQVENLPSWLSFDSSSRTFSGTPQESDVGSFDVTLVGTDNSDQSQLSNTYTMIVSNDTGLYLSSSKSLFSELSKSGQTNGLDGLVVKPGQDIKIQFSKDLFQSYSSSDRPIIAYYGRSGDRSSLPNWLEFDGEALTFSGTVPYVTSENAPSFEYTFAFIASDYYGYAGAEGDFKIVVGGHQLSTSINSTTIVNGTIGEEIDIDVPVLSQVYLDGSEISRGNISSVSAENLPSYATFSDKDYSISGQFPNTTTNDNFTIIVKDVYGNQVELPYSLDAVDSIFTVDSINSVNATRGEYFQYQILKSLFTNYDSTKVSVDVSSDWLTYQSSNMTLTGTTPKDFDNLNVKINAEAGSDKESRSFQIKGVDSKVTSTSSSSSSSTSSATSSSSSSSSSTSSTATSSSSAPVATNKSASNKNKALAIGLGVGIPVFLILLAAIIFFCCCFKRRKNKKDSQKAADDNEKDTFNPRKPAPVPLGLPLVGSQESLKDRSQVNVMKLEHNRSSSSNSLTQVETSSVESYYETHENTPIVKSWRANTASDNKRTRASDASLSTVNTENLFSIRLVEDNSMRNSETSSKFLSNNSLNALLRRDNSSNFQRLDSNGNIAHELNSHSNRSSQSEKFIPPLSSSNLDIVPEENSRELKQTGRDETNGTISHLLNRFNDNTSDDFKEPEPTPTIDRLPSPTYILDTKKESPTSDTFMHDESTPVNNNHAPTMKNQNHSMISLGSISSDKLFFDNSNPRKHAPPNAMDIGNSAKLVDFTRKGSLRESAYEPDYVYQEESASIQIDDSD